MKHLVLASLFAGILCSDATAQTLDELRAVGTPVSAAPTLIHAAPRRVVGDPRGCLSKGEAESLARLTASQVNGGFTVVNSDDVVDGGGLPVSAVYICERTTMPLVFDFAVVDAGDGKVRVRQVIARETDVTLAAVGEGRPERVPLSAIRGRVIGTIFFNPARSDTSHLTGLLSESAH